MKILTDTGSPVTLDDFGFTPEHVDLLKRMVRLTPNLLIRAHDAKERLVELPVSRFMVDEGIINDLNAERTAAE